VAAADAPRSRLAGLISKRAFAAVNLAQAAACAVAAALLSTSAQWHRLGLLAVLAAFTMVAELGGVASPGQLEGVSVSTLGLALAMTFLGPAPAVVIAVVPITIESLRRRVSVEGILNNVATYSMLTLVGSLAIGAALGGHPPSASPRWLLLAVFLLVLAADSFSFVWVALLRAVEERLSLRRAFRQAFLPMLPFELVSAALTGAAAVVYLTAGLLALSALLAVLIVSVRLIRVISVVEAQQRQVAELAVARARLLGEALTAEERERVRLAGEIHDDALQELAIARLELRSPGGAESAARRLEAADAALRAALSRIVPAAEMRAGGLSAVLDTMAADLCGPAGVEWQVRVDPELDGRDGTLVAALARELLTNVVKHAGASRVSIEAGRSDGRVRLRVADDGRGFDAAQTTRHGHVGLALLENRARAAGGHLQIESAPGAGTTVEVELESR
jgi:two-component system, NarL family, sensor kinase